MASPHKWLEIHGRKKWAYYYAPGSVARQTAFFDRFLKDEPNQVDTWPPVRLEIRERANTGNFRDEQEWPLARTRYTPLYLDAATGSLQAVRPEQEGIASYQATEGRAIFDHTFGGDTELTGYMKLRLWAEAQGADNMDLFIGVQKLDQQGERVTFPFFSTFDDGDVALGWLRVSRRELDDHASTPYQPVYRQQQDKLLSPGEVVPVEIEIWPSGTLFQAGETLRLVIQGHDLHTYPENAFAQRHAWTVNTGRHVLHTGGRYDSHLLIPVIPA
jgi:putative CocE/NonD family hydrolase